MTTAITKKIMPSLIKPDSNGCDLSRRAIKTLINRKTAIFLQL